MGSTQANIQEDFSDYEKVFLHASRAFAHLNKEHLSIHCICTITHSAQPDRQTSIACLRESWKQLAIEYPGLKVRPTGFTKHFLPLNETNLETWANQTFFPSSEDDADTIIAESKPRDLPSLYFLEQSSEVVFLSQHWRTDALGCCMLLDRLFQILAEGASVQASLRKEPRGLSPCMEVAAGSSLVENEEIRAYARERIATFHQKAVKSGGLPFEGDSQRLPGRTAHRELTFDTEETSNIVRTCKSLDISVSAAVQAALARTYFSFAEDEEEKKEGYTAVVAVNMRHFLRSPYHEREHACQTYVSSITPTVPHAAGFVDAARDLTVRYKSWRTQQLLDSLAWMYKYNVEVLFGPKPEAKVARATGMPPKPPSGVTLSSLGIVESYLKARYGDSVNVEKFRFGVSMMTRQTLLYAWTFRGELTLSFDFNEAYHTDEMAKEILARVRAFLEEGLARKAE